MENSRKSILIVEDDAALSQALVYALRVLNCDIIVANDGIVAEEKLATLTPDLIFLDLQLPGKDGFDVLKGIRENDATKHIPVIVLTNFEKTVTMAKFSGHEFQEYIVKASVKLTDLTHYVVKYLGDAVLQQPQQKSIPYNQK